MDDYIDKLEVELKSRGYSKKTVKAYVFHVSCFLSRMERKASKEDIQKYFISLTETKDPRTVNLRISAVKFFYLHVIGREIDINFMKRPKRIPEVLTKKETLTILNNINNAKHRLLIETIYGCGLRVSEATSLKKQDLRFDENLMMIRQAKGRKDRFVMLPTSISSRLKSYIYARVDENPYVFDSARGGHLTIKSVQLIFQKAVKKSKILKNVHVHTLRHSYATHLLENGTDIKIIQKLLGHSSLRTTEIYTHISNQFIKNVVSPLDILEIQKNDTKTSHNIQTDASFTNKTS